MCGLQDTINELIELFAIFGVDSQSDFDTVLSETKNLISDSYFSGNVTNLLIDYWNQVNTKAENMIKFNWSVRGFNTKTIFPDLEQVIKQSLVYSDFSSIVIPITFDPDLDLEDAPVLLTSLFLHSEFILSGCGIIAPESRRTGGRACYSGYGPTKLIEFNNRMDLRTSCDELTQFGNYVLLDIAYPRVQGLSIAELMKLRDDEGNLFRIFNRKIYLIVEEYYAKGLTNTQSINEMFEQVDYEVAKLIEESKKISTRSSKVNFEYGVLAVYALLSTIPILSANNYLPLSPELVDSLGIVSGIAGSTKISDIVKIHRDTKFAKTQLRQNPFYWPYMIEEQNQMKSK